MKRAPLIVLVVILLILAGCGRMANEPRQDLENREVDPMFSIKHLGQSAFLLKFDGLTIVTDPYGKKNLTYPPLELESDVVTVSHLHVDHSNTAAVKGDPLILYGIEGSDWVNIDREVDGVRIRTVATYHDDQQGSSRGKNAVFVFEGRKITIAHLGDLGHKLSEEQVQAIGDVDVLLIPVGGTYTIDAAQAWEVVRQFNPKLVVPMHYKNKYTKWQLAGVEPFAKGHRCIEVKEGWKHFASLPDEQYVLIWSWE